MQPQNEIRNTLQTYKLTDFIAIAKAKINAIKQAGVLVDLVSIKEVKHREELQTFTRILINELVSRNLQTDEVLKKLTGQAARVY